MNIDTVYRALYSEELLRTVYSILEVDNLLIINMDVICNRAYNILGTDELLYEIGRRGKDKALVFVFQDGASIELSGAYGVIQHSIRQLNLTPDCCFVFYPDEIIVPGATVLNNRVQSSWELQSRQMLANVPLAEPVFDKHFCALFARFNLYRLKLVRHLVENYPSQSLVAFNTTNVVYGSRFVEFFDDDYRWAKERLPMRLEGNNDTVNQADGFLRFQDALSNMDNLYQRYFIEVVSETDPHSKIFFTEKTVKNFWLGKPFLLYSAAGALENLHSKGYATFGPYIDESYDKVENDFDRLEMIKCEINRLAAMSIDELRSMHIKLRDVFEYNRSLVKLNTREWALSNNG